VPTDDGRARRLAVVLGSVAVLAAGIAVARSTNSGSDSGPRAGSGPLPSSIVGRTATASTPVPAPVGLAGLPPAARAAIAAASHHLETPSFDPGVPVGIDIPIPSPTHPDGVHARVTSHDLNPDGTLYVPSDPRTVSWAREDAQPGSSHGTAILTSHINFVINGHLVIGAMSDLAWYAQHAVGKQIALHLKDGRVLHYRIVAGREYSKDQLANNPDLRRELYDQSRVYGPPGRPSGRLLLVSCGGAFDQYTGEYQDNVFLYLLPA
jgi:hypothetical protein